MRISFTVMKWTAKKMLESGVEVFVVRTALELNNIDSKNVLVGSCTFISKEGVFPGYKKLLLIIFFYLSLIIPCFFYFQN